MAKDKFKQMQQGGGVLGSFQESLVQAATTVAAIEKQAEQTTKTPTAPKLQETTNQAQSQDNESPRYMRLPNPQIPVREYNLVSQYCNTFTNMTRQDFVELAILEKLHNDQQIPDDEFEARKNEIRNRPTRGQRKNTKNQTSN